MDIEIYSLGQLQTNCYFLVIDDACLIVDPADEASFILEKIQREELELVGMVATHGHFDHILAAGEIQLSFDVPLYINPADEFLLNRMNATAEHFLDYDPAVVEPQNVLPLRMGENEIDVFSFEAIQTPGHTPGSMSLYFPDELAIFTGDTLFKKAIGRYDFSYASFEELQSSLNRLLELPEETIVYPGHGDETTIGDARRSNTAS